MNSLDDTRIRRSAILGRAQLLAAYIAAYVALDWATDVYAFEPFSITPWNPGTGLSLALLLAGGLRWAPALVIAPFAADLAWRGLQVPIWFSALSSITTALGYAALAWLLLRAARIDTRFTRLSDTAWFSVMVAPATLLIALAYVSLLVATDLAPLDRLQDYTLRYWTGDMIGVIVTTPLLLVYRGWQDRFPAARALTIESAAQVAAILLVLWLVLGMQPANAPKSFYLLFLPLIWIAMRHGIHGTVIASAIAQVGLIIGARLTENEASIVLELQFRLLVLAVTGLFLGVAVTQWRRTQNELMHREGELRTIIGTAPDGILSLDGQGRISSLNAAAEAMFGVGSASGVGRPLADLIPGVTAPLRPVQAKEMIARRGDGSEFPVELSLAEIHSGSARGSICTIRDVSRRKQMEDQLRDRQVELEQTLRLAATSELASALAHELNQPLSAISSYVQACRLLLTGHEADHPRLLQTMDKVINEVSRSGEVVRRLREFYRSGTVHLERAAVSDLIERGIEPSAPRIERNRIALRVDSPRELPEVLVDKIQIETVIHNLVSNAVDAMSASPRRELRVRATAARARELEITVADSGSGLAPETVAGLFRPLTSAKPGGMGLGLAISRSIVEAHGGRIEYLRQEDGSLFRVTLPLDSR